MVDCHIEAGDWWGVSRVNIGKEMQLVVLALALAALFTNSGVEVWREWLVNAVSAVESLCHNGLTLSIAELHLTTSELWFGQEQEGILP